MANKHLAAAVVIASSLACTSASAWDQYPFDQYLQRRNTVTFSAGDAKAANTVTHMINPWPPYVFDRRIPGNGERMVGAVERYRDVGRINRVPCPIVPQFDIQQSGVRSTGTLSQCGQSPPALGVGTTGNAVTTQAPGGGTTTTSSTVTAPIYGR